MKVIEIKLGTKIIIPECRVANTYWIRFWGLMRRTSVRETEGVLFPRCNSIHTFFMRFPIDVILLSHDGSILHIVENLKPWRLVLPRRGVRHVIEVMALRTKSLKLQTGETLDCGGELS